MNGKFVIFLQEFPLKLYFLYWTGIKMGGKKYSASTTNLNSIGTAKKAGPFSKLLKVQTESI